ncbi:MAG: head-tail connector protein [Alphaproteobacteria bacterium]
MKAAILLLVGHWYANREAVVTGTIATQLPMAVDALLAPLRRVGI